MSPLDLDLIDDDVVDLGELGASLGFLIRIAQVQSFEAFYKALEKHGLKPGEFTVLWVIGLNPGLRQGAVGRRLSIKPAHMTKLVQRMVSAGYVKRTVPANDRRSVRLTLTPSGEAFVAKNRKELLNRHKAERSALSDAEFAQLVRLLRKLTGMDGTVP